MKNKFLTKIKENFNAKAFIIAIALAATICVGAILGFNALIILGLNGTNVYPKEFPVSVIGAVISVIVFIIFLAVYLRFRKIKPTRLSAAIDFVAFILSLPLFYYTFLWVLKVIN